MNTFNLFGDIVDNDADRWYESDVTPAMVVGWLKKQGGAPVEVNINSAGGSVTAGLAIANALKAYEGEVTCNVLGVAASMASVVACAGDVMKIGQGAFVMIHNPWAMTLGDAEDLRAEADLLDKMRESIIGFYQSKTTASADELKALMDAETWLSAEDLAAFGFTVGSYAEEFKAAAHCRTRSRFARAPKSARAYFSEADKPGVETVAPTAAEAEAPAAEPEQTAAEAEAPAAEAEAPAAEVEAPAAEPEQTAAEAEAPAAEAEAPAAETPADKRLAGLQAAKDREIAALRQQYADYQRRSVEALAAAEAQAKDQLARLETDYEAKINDLRSDIDAKASALDSAASEIKQLTTKCAEVAEALASAQAALATAEQRYRDQVGVALQQPVADSGSQSAQSWRKAYAEMRREKSTK